jgi:hypothetical protein
MNPKDVLVEGTQFLDAVLQPCGFLFELKGEGGSCGGIYAWGEYLRNDRILELHFRHSLGLVRYHLGPHNVAHEAYMKELGVREQCRYPGFSSNPLDTFHGLVHDLQFAGDFLTGDASTLKIAATNASVVEERKSQELMARYVGDVDLIEKMRALLKQSQYSEVVSLFGELKYPERLSRAQLRMVEIALNSGGG